MLEETLLPSGHPRLVCSREVETTLADSTHRDCGEELLVFRTLRERTPLLQGSLRKLPKSLLILRQVLPQIGGKLIRQLSYLPSWWPPVGVLTVKR